jgi:general secretion pathway protein E
VDIRTATLETSYGETAVLRILDRDESLFNLGDLGFRPDALNAYQEMLKSPFGIILVSGPTGSGKTTTLYASLNQLDRVEQNIMTIEDPIEYRFADIKQTQVNEKAGVSFASALRAMMRLDPDVILVGEIRDAETAKTAVQAALTGHLVLSSIHANDAASVPFRLRNLGVEEYLISSVIVGVVAQRMLRRICSHCKTRREPGEEERQVFQQEFGDKKEAKIYTGVGCNFCSNTGYLERIGAFEILPFSSGIRRALQEGSTPLDLRELAVKEGMVTLKRDGMLKVRQGITTPSEVLRNVFSIG